MIRLKAIIERAGDGNYSVYMDDDDMSYLVTGTGKTAEEAEFDYEYDMASFLSYYSKAFSLAGLSRITGINQGQLSHYVTGRRVPSARTKEKMQHSIHKFAEELKEVKFV